MNRFAFLLLAIAAVLIVPSAAKAQAAAGSATTGKELYISYACYSCHGFDGHGGSGGAAQRHEDVAGGVHGVCSQPGADAGVFDKVLTDTQLADLYAYIKSLPDSPPAKNIPLLVQIMSGN